MNWLFALLDRLPLLLSATTRLVRAAKETEPPPADTAPDAASAYLKGHAAGRFSAEEAQRVQKAAAELAKKVDEL